jgi:hypothetical protein
VDDGKLDMLGTGRFTGMSKIIKSTPMPLLATPLKAQMHQVCAALQKTQLRLQFNRRT